MKWMYLWFVFALSCLLGIRTSAQIAAFTLPDTVCVNSSVHINNLSAGGTTWYWNFCVADIGKPPEALNLGNIGGLFQDPVYVDMDSVNNHFYGFVINNNPSGMIRLDFGNSLLNTPVPTNMGNFGGIIPSGGGAEGIQIVYTNGKYYGLLVGWDLVTTGSPAKMVQFDFGADLGNPNPIAHDWNNLGNLSQPIDFKVFNDNGHWYGFTASALNNNIIRFDFGTDFDNPPVAVNLGNVGGMLNYPSGICAVNDGGFWRLFITNRASPSLVRLDFGNSVLNTPVPVNLGNPGGTMHLPRGIAVQKFCDQTIGYYLNEQTNDIVKLDFDNGLSSQPVATSLGNIGGFDFPHSLSKLFRVGPDLYCFSTSVRNRTMTRLKFSGCTNSSIPNSILKDPPDIVYSQTGTFNINLTMNDGLPTATTFCKTVVVINPPAPYLGGDAYLCQGDSLVLRYRAPNLAYTWQDDSSLDSFLVRSGGQYKLTVTNAGCSKSDSVTVRPLAYPLIITLPDTAICKGATIILTTQLQNHDGFSWLPANGLTDPAALSPVVRPTIPTRYIITAANQSCLTRDTIMVTLKDTPFISTSNDTLLCAGQIARLQAVGANAYLWSPVEGLSDPAQASPFASPDSTTRYQVLATALNGCTATDSVQVIIRKPDIFRAGLSRNGICAGDTVLLRATGGDPGLGDTYEWIPAPIGQDPGKDVIGVFPPASATYQLVGYDKVCDFTDTIPVLVMVNPPPVVTISKSNDIDCLAGEANLTAAGGVSYTWTPARGLSDPFRFNPVARTDMNTRYYVAVTDVNGCTTRDSVDVLVSKGSGSIGNPVANAFTPNGDGRNDCFGIKYWGYIAQFEMSIFDRWGVRVFYSQSSDLCWDGRYMGQPQPGGSYVYLIRARTLCGPVTKTGSLLLIR